MLSTGITILKYGNRQNFAILQKLCNPNSCCCSTRRLQQPPRPIRKRKADVDSMTTYTMASFFQENRSQPPTTTTTPSSSCSSTAFLPCRTLCLFLRKTQLSDQGNGKISVKVAWALLPLPHVTKSYFYWKRNSTNPMTSSIKISCLRILRHMATRLW